MAPPPLSNVSTSVPNCLSSPVILRHRTTETRGSNHHKRAPVHLVTGSAGCKEGRDHFKHNPAHWSAFRSQDFGYTRFKAYNGTHINMEQVSVDLEGQVIDSFWLVKDKKISYNML